MNDEERNKLILDSFGKLATPEMIRSLSKGAEYIRQAEKEYKEVLAERIMYNQHAYGL